jgi:hypothetical protein
MHSQRGASCEDWKSALSLDDFNFTTIVILLSFNCVYPNPPCQLSLWEETAEHPGKTHDFRQSVDRLFSHESVARIEPTNSEVKGSCSDDCAMLAVKGASSDDCATEDASTKAPITNP